MDVVSNFDKECFLSNEQAIFHFQDKFIIDFKNVYPQLTPDNQQAIITNHRVILLDVYVAKSFLECLKLNISNYEKTFGEIKTDIKIANININSKEESPSYLG